MHHPLTIAILTVLCWSLPAVVAHSQTIYRCGNSYSQAPCPGATSLDVSDTRTPAQKAEADAQTSAAARAADTMEKERLAAERSAPSRRPETAQAHTAAAQSEAPGRKGAKKTKPPAPYFVATVPAEKTKAKNPKPKEKTGSKTVAATP